MPTSSLWEYGEGSRLLFLPISSSWRYFSRPYSFSIWPTVYKGHPLVVVDHRVRSGAEQLVLHQTCKFLLISFRQSTIIRPTEYRARISPISPAYSSPNSLLANKVKNSRWVFRLHRSLSQAMLRNHSIGSSRNFIDPTLRIQISVVLNE